jgi:Probable cobalt transporter subunit (CbtA)
MEKRLILRGMIAGGFAGLLAALFTRIMAEPWIQKSIDYQSASDPIEDAWRKARGLAPLPPGPDILSRAVQRNLGAPVGLLVFGMAMGALFAVAFVLLYRRYGDQVSARTIAAGLAAAAFLAIYFVPFLKYPANPPAIGHPATIHARGDLYLGMVGVSIASMIGACFLSRHLISRWGGWNGAIATGIVFIAWIAIVMAIFPPLGHLHSNVVAYGKQVTETPQPIYNTAGKLIYPGFPADVLFKFRLYSVLNQILLWSTIGLTFGLLAERALASAKTAETGEWAIPRVAEPAI